MADLQQKFESFHQKIRTSYPMLRKLDEHAGALLDDISGALAPMGHVAFWIRQGSLAMNTGVCPVGQCTFDLDLGVVFDHRPEVTAKDLRQLVLDAVDSRQRDVEEKGTCIRVHYAKRKYHVDIVAYARASGDVEGRNLWLAKDNNEWVQADPLGLLAAVDTAAQGFAHTADADGCDQLRRVVRYLKRWDDEAISRESPAKPCGLALTLLAINALQPTVSWDGTSDDAGALLAVASAAATSLPRLVATKPTPQYEDLFECLTDQHMTALIDRFAKLRGALDFAVREPDASRATKVLAAVFGSAFPVVEPTATSLRTRAPAIVTHSSSA